MVSADKKKKIMSFAGIFRERSEEWAKIEEELYAARKRFKFRDFKF